MKVFSILMVFVFSFAGTLSANHEILQKKCDAVEAKADVQQTSNGMDNGRVTITLVRGDASTVKYIFCHADGKVINESQFSTNTLDGLKKGKYICIVSTSDCSKNVSFTIK